MHRLPLRRVGLGFRERHSYLITAMTEEQDQAIYSAYLGISVLRTMCRKAGLHMGEARAAELMVEMDTAFPGLAGRSALRSKP